MATHVSTRYGNVASGNICRWPLLLGDGGPRSDISSLQVFSLCFFSIFRDLDLFSELKKLLCRSPTLTQRLLSLLLLWWRLCVGRLSVCSDPCVLVCPLFLRRAVTAEAVGFLSAVGVFIAALALVFLFINKMLCFSRVGGAPCLEQSRRSRNERSPGLRQGLGETPPYTPTPSHVRIVAVVSVPRCS